MEQGSPPIILNRLSDLGLGFNCGSPQELKTISTITSNSQDIIISNPCKPASLIMLAQVQGVKRMAFDSQDELEKIMCMFPEAELVLRFRVNPSSEVAVEEDGQPTSIKFGASMSEAIQLTQSCKTLGANLIGVSFHVERSVHTGDNFVGALNDARVLCDEAKKIGFAIKLVDIGGGFTASGSSNTSGDVNNTGLEDVAEVINTCLESMFPVSENIEIIGEPGRFFVEDCQTLFANILLKKKEDENSETLFKYYLSEGVHSSFRSALMGSLRLSAAIFGRNPRDTETKYRSIIYGPTTDEDDCAFKNVHCQELFMGEWLYFEKMGSYTSSLCSPYAGARKAKKVYVDA
eukprot:TRINITY_DN3518_c0_g2_i2.p1 TRINITY_DN3518_c0_g2~~TRINITY_DN3518_c0_g2_i2.p1  ORF type:complete len:348 (-),score=75.19 TRINITY_DN3518_c0_g2_i2:175-1218(-)